MLKQKCFSGCKPKRPTTRTPAVARMIAERLLKRIVESDIWDWWDDPKRIDDIAGEIARRGRPSTAIERLARTNHDYAWEGLDELCREYGGKIGREELAKAIAQWERYQ